MTIEVSNGKNEKNVFIVRLYHVIIILVGWVIIAVVPTAMYVATMKAELEDTMRRVEQIEKRTYLTREEYEPRHMDVVKRIERLEKHNDDEEEANRRFLRK